MAPPQPPAGGQAGDDEFLDRDLSWLEFNYRVLNEALDPRTPLLERVRFLMIFSSNLDEFFMKRLGGIRNLARPGTASHAAGGMVPPQLLTQIRLQILELLWEQAECFTKTIRPALAEQGIHLLEWDQLDPQERQWAREFFLSNIYPILTPLAVDTGHPFPFISNLSTSLGVVLCPPDREERSFARVKVPEALPGWVRCPPAANDGRYRFIRVRDIIQHNFHDLFPGMQILAIMQFRVTRGAPIEREDEEADDLRDLVEQELRQRRFADVVRLEHDANPDPWILQFLMQELKLQPEDVYRMPGELDYDDLRPIADLNLPSLRNEPWQPVIPSYLESGVNIFKQIRQGDLLVHHPYESFNASVERFITAAAEDPKVLAIKMTVYRTGDESPFIHTLIRAAEAKKQVVCLVELQARFDEERNILVAHALEKAGVHVVYGVLGLKTHTKTTLVVRQDPDGIRCYAHIGTGNYHVQTARLYTDLGLFTCKSEITDDLVALFHYLTGRSLQRSYRKLIVAPVAMRDRYLAMIEREMEHQRAGRPAQIVAKMNSLEDRTICRALQAASNAGVRINLFVRGFCCLRPEVPGQSENIRIVSVIGRFLEHSRIFFFRNGAENALEGEFYIGSADWMYRNLLERVEAVVPVEDRALREKLWEILQVMMNDNRQAWDMQADGSFVQRRSADGAAEKGTHQTLMALTRQRSSAAPATPRFL
jgi:polyphosphate kinase